MVKRYLFSLSEILRFETCDLLHCLFEILSRERLLIEHMILEIFYVGGKVLRSVKLWALLTTGYWCVGQQLPILLEDPEKKENNGYSATPKFPKQKILTFVFSFFITAQNTHPYFNGFRLTRLFTANPTQARSLFIGTMSV